MFVVAAVSGWYVVQTIIIAVIPLLSAIVSAFYWLHKRISKLEDATDQAGGALYGVEGDPLQVGIAKEVKGLKENQRDIENKVEEIKEEVQ